jgi:thiol:disulfide interchange protein DsbA
MQQPRRSFISGILALGAMLGVNQAVLAQVAGKDYTMISPAQQGSDAGKIEVIEFFGYFCPHCRDAFDALHAWAAKLPSDVVLKKVPISFNRPPFFNWQRLYYTLEATGDLARLDKAAFRAAQDERLPLATDEEAIAWAVRNGVDGKKFSDAWKSFSVASNVKRAQQLERDYKISGVPALAVDGKYMIGDMSFDNKLLVADKLIAKARAERSGKK